MPSVGSQIKILVIDIGGTNVKILATGESEPRKVPSGPKMTPRRMVTAVKKLAADWTYDRVSIGYPGLVAEGQPTQDPHNLAKGWVEFDFERAFARPVRIMNDAAMQALGSHKAGLMLFIGLGTGLGSAVVTDRCVIPLELAHLSYRNGTYEDYVGVKGFKEHGRKKWEHHVAFGIERLINAIHPDDVVIGGGNAKKLKELPAGCRAGDNANAFLGGFRIWSGRGEES